MELLENDARYFDDFIRLNEEWISHYFELEAADRALAANPQKVINDGGYIFCLLDDGKVLGVCALFYSEPAVYELARMAVSPLAQGRGLSHQLMDAALSKLKCIEARKVYLISNTKLEPAIALYKKHGFDTVSIGQHPVYARADIVMERLV